MSKSQPHLTIHYDRPVSHQGVPGGETRFVLPKFLKKLTKTIKLLDLKITPRTTQGVEVPCYWAALGGAYNLVGRSQVRLDGVESSYFYTPQVMSFMVPSAGNNDQQKCVFSQLHGTGNNILYNANSKKLYLERYPVSQYPSEIRLSLLNNFLANIGCAEDQLEIIINWNQDIAKYLIPINPNDTIDPAKTTIDLPYISYETYDHSSIQQPSKFLYTEIIGEEIAIDPITTDNTQQLVSRLTNSFNQKTIKRILFQTTPQNLFSNSDATNLRSVFGGYLSVAQKNEVVNFIEDGQSVLTNRGVNNDSIKLSTTVDSFGVNSCIASGAHTNVQNPVLTELQGGTNQLNSYFSWGCVDLNRKIESNFQVSYQRSSYTTDYPSLKDGLVLGCYGECQVAWVDGQKVYV